MGMIALVDAVSNVSSQGRWSRWRTGAKLLRIRDRTGIIRKDGYVLVSKVEY